MGLPVPKTGDVATAWPSALRLAGCAVAGTPSSCWEEGTAEAASTSQVFASSYGVDDSDALLSDTKAFGAAITGSAIIFAGFSFLNKTPLETLGLLMSAYFLALADSEFVTKWGAGMGMTEGKMIPWMALQGLTALTIFTGGKGGGEVSVRN